MTVDWDADEEALVGWLWIDGKRTRLCATVDTIHQHAAGFDDAVIYEIEKHRQEIFEKLVPFLGKRMLANSANRRRESWGSWVNTSFCGQGTKKSGGVKS
jgi:hypothetical protein